MHDGATLEDAYRCITYYNDLVNHPAICEQIETFLESFFLYMFEEWQAMDDIYAEIVQSLDSVMKGYKNGKSLISYLYKPSLYIFPQLDGEIVYGIEAECPWEPEHMCLILIRNEMVVYVGPS